MISLARATRRGHGYRREFAIFSANQGLIKQRVVAPSRTTLVRFVDEGGGNKTTAECLAGLRRDEVGVISLSESWTDEALRYLRREKHTDGKVKMAALNYAICFYIYVCIMLNDVIILVSF